MSLIIILIRITVYLLEKKTLENKIIVFLKSMNNQLANNFKCNN